MLDHDPIRASDAVIQRLRANHPTLIDLTTGRVERLLAALGHPERRLPPVIHVAGTNGKGSTVAFLRAIAEAQGLKVHLIIVDNDGKVQNGDRYLTLSGDAVGFAVPVVLTGDRTASVQLAVSIAVPVSASIDAFTLAQGTDANAFFDRLRQELAAKHLVATVGVSPFAVD